ncbi:outer membrane transport energization protein TonB [Fontimonas thermophila]|uniref:Outer membrane transport energization protein TonB n=1 Tax=Fontimonas thermophila TaxID=1076937 RepID=A0A1I2IX09_9GAMM|nr:AgmX/PglI C-terminal domain-containing protein [Fontimonas thermophila]SFF47032.1 outer membrane transport energization protein TonB [Fontimonas thermophila]
MTAQTIHWQSWDLAAESDRRFRRLVLIVGIPLLAIGLIIPFLELVGLTRGGGTLTGSRYVELLPEQPAPVAEKVEEPKPAEQDQPKPETVKAEPQTAPEPPPEVRQQQAVERARATAARSGVMAFADQLQALHTGVASLQRPDQALRSLDSTSGGGAVTSGDSQVFEQSAAQNSGGIGTPNATGTTRRTQTGTGLGERRTTVVESPVGFGQDRTRPGQGGDKLIAGRTLEEIQLVFDRNKGAFTAIYNRAARENPNLGAGKIVISLTIAPDGSVTECKLVSSTFNDPELERKIVQRVLLMNFGAKNVPPYTYPNYPIHFLPS